MGKHRVGRVEQARTLVEVVRAHAVREHEQRIRGEYRRAERGKLISVRAEQHERKGHEDHSRPLQVHEGLHVDGDLPKHRCQERLGGKSTNVSLQCGQGYVSACEYRLCTVPRPLLNPAV
eukprot:scaffold24368_cov63-Phaeocystis_antarctica.AAC.3